jgi:low temperature requirement protein LtrA
MQGMESQENWPPAAALSAILGMGVPFLICWWYFDRTAGTEQRVRTRRDAVRLHVWTYAHFPLYLGIVVVGVGIQRVVTAASHYAVSESERLILATGAATVLAAMTMISSATEPRSAVGTHHPAKISA